MENQGGLAIKSNSISSPSPRNDKLGSAIKIKEQKFMSSDEIYQQSIAGQTDDADMKNELN